MTPHPADGLLVLWLDGELEPAEADAVRRHVEACEDCQTRHTAYRRVSEGIVLLHGMTEAAPARRRNIWWWPAAAAAALLVAVFWGWPPARPVVALPPVAIATVPAPPSPAPVVRAAVKKPAGPAAEAKPAAEFISLPFSDQSLPLSDSPVVRVSLPVESLRLASFRVSPQVEGHTILADVVLGMDGLPRAIRLVE